MLLTGIVALEFAAAVSRLVDDTLLPAIAEDLSATGGLSRLVVGDSLGLFLALPLARAVADRLGLGASLTLGTVGHLAGLAVAVTSQTSTAYLAGRFAAGFFAGLLGVFGIAAAVEALDDQWRTRLVAAASGMWVLPSLVGPAASAAAERAVGWRWTMLLPVPLLVLGRLVVGHARRRTGDTRPDTAPDDGRRIRPAGLLVPVGAVLVVVAEQRSLLLLAVGLVAALVGLASLLPRGSLRVRRGTPAACAALTLFATGYFGASALIAVLMTRGYGTDLLTAAAVVSLSPLAWALTALVAARWPSLARRSAGLALSATCVTLLALGARADLPLPVAATGWAAVGVGIGMSYPPLYVAATRLTPGTSAVTIASAVILAEAFGTLLGPALGAVTVSRIDGATGLTFAYLLFAAAIALAALVATRSDQAGPKTEDEQARR